MKTIKDFFKKKPALEELPEDKKKKIAAQNPTNAKVGIMQIKDYNKRRKAQLDQIMAE